MPFLYTMPNLPRTYNYDLRRYYDSRQSTSAFEAPTTLFITLLFALA